MQRRRKMCAKERIITHLIRNLNVTANRLYSNNIVSFA